jgi:hypothetical protein
MENDGYRESPLNRIYGYKYTNHCGLDDYVLIAINKYLRCQHNHMFLGILLIIKIRNICFQQFLGLSPTNPPFSCLHGIDINVVQDRITQTSLCRIQ